MKKENDTEEEELFELYDELDTCRLCEHKYKGTNWICSHCGVCINCGEHDRPYTCIIWTDTDTLVGLL